jgi:transposase InsO family protein
MPKHTLDSIATQEIRAALAGLQGKRLTAEVRRQAEFYEVTTKTVYEITADLRPKRKARADKGQRKGSLLESDALAFAAELVVTRNLDPDLALQTARLNGYEADVALGTFQRYLREHGLSRRERNNPVRAHRRWEAAAPGDIFQFDMSAVKERWLDVSTRRILKVTPLEVSKNHPNTNPDRIPLWKFGLVDDHSRLKYVRFYAVGKPTSNEVIDFLLGAFRRYGVPKALYTDNDVTIISKRMRRAESILHRAFEESGGFKLDQHLPGNPQATGKVERGHQIFEKFEKLIGVKFETPGLAELNQFCEYACEAYNTRPHSTTGVAPLLRWQSQLHTLRVPTPDVLDSAFKVEEFDRRINDDLTISYKATRYQLPRKRPFTDWVTKTVRVIWPGAESDWFAVMAPANTQLEGTEFFIDRKAATADEAGQFKQPEESTRQQSVKRLRAQAKARKEQMRAQGEELRVPGFDAPIAEVAQFPVMMPKPKVELQPERLAEIAPGAVPPTAAPRTVSFWEALGKLINDESLTNSPTDKDWLRAVFAGREEIEESELRAALDARHHQPAVIQFERRNVG